MAGPFDTIPIDEDAQFLADMDPYYASTPDEPEPEPSAEELAPVELGEQFERDMAAALAMDRSQQSELAMEPLDVGSELTMDPLDVGAPPVQALDQFELDMIANAPASFGELPTGFGSAPFIEQPSDLGADTALDLSPGREMEDAPLQPEEYAQQPDEIALSDLNDEALLMRQFDDAQLVKAERQRLTDVEMVANENRQAENAEFLRSSQEKHLSQVETILQESREIGSMKIDQDRWYSSGGAGRKIGTWVSVLAGGQLGLLSGRGGNAGLDFVMGEINKDIDIQKSNIQNARVGLNQQQGLVSEIYKVTGDMFRAEETARLAALETVDARISSEMAKLDPEGSQAMEKEMLLRDVRGRKAQSVAALQEQSRTRAIEDAEFEMKVRDQRVGEAETKAKILKMQAETTKLKRRGTGRKRVKAPSIKDQETLTKGGWMPFLDRNGMRIPAEGKRAEQLRAGTGDSSESIEGARLRGAAAIADKAELELSKDERSRKFGTRMFTKTGEEILAVDSATAIKRQLAKSQLKTVTNLADDLIVMRESDGWSSDMARSEEWQIAQGKLVQILLVNKEAFNLGVLSGSDEELMNKFAGGGDPTAIRSMVAGLNGMVSNLTDQFNDSVLAPVGEEVERYEPARHRVIQSGKKNKASRIDSVSQGVPIGLEGEDRDAVLGQSISDAEYSAKNDNLSLEDMRRIGMRSARRQENGELTGSELKQLTDPIARKFVRSAITEFVTLSKSAKTFRFGLDEGESYIKELQDAMDDDDIALKILTTPTSGELNYWNRNPSESPTYDMDGD